MMPFVLFRASNPWRGLCWSIAVRSLPSLRESYLCRALVSVFAVAKIFAMRFPPCARQRNLYRAGTHDKDRLHGIACFSRSVYSYHERESKMFPNGIKLTLLNVLFNKHIQPLTVYVKFHTYYLFTSNLIFV
jgi:hypothetical protein